MEYVYARCRKYTRGQTSTSSDVSKMTKDEIQDMATKVGKNTIEDMVLFMKGNMHLDSFLKWLEIRMKNL